MLDHADQHLARLVAFLDTAGIRDNTLILVMSDNGASQEGGPLGFVNAMGPYNFRPEPIAEKLRRIDDIGGPDTHTNFPHGWAMASNTPLRRYKQNTHGGGIRDPFVMSWPKRIAAKGELRHQFVHACDLTPTLLDLIGIAPPAEIAGVRADADRRRELCALDQRSCRAVKNLAAIFRDVRASRDLAGRLEGGRLPSLGHAVRERQMGAVSSRRRIFRKPNDLAAQGARAARGDDQAVVERGREAQCAAARRPLRPALCRERRALPRRAQQIHLSRRHGARADRRRARRAQPQLHHRGPCRDRRGGRRGRADRAWRCDVRLQPLHQGRPAGARPQYRRRPRDRDLGPQGAVGRAPARRACRAPGAQGAAGQGIAHRRHATTRC